MNFKVIIIAIISTSVNHNACKVNNNTQATEVVANVIIRDQLLRDFPWIEFYEKITVK